MRLLTLALILLLSGCNTFGPAIGGRLNWQVELTDVVTQTEMGPEQKTGYKAKIKAPAGTNIAGIANAKYKWEGGEFEIMNEGDADTQGQAALLLQQTQIMSEMMSILAPIIKTAFETASPVDLPND